MTDQTPDPELTPQQRAGDGPPEFPTAQCASCHAPIIWTVTVKDVRLPVDAEPVDVNTGHGSVLIHPRGHLAPLAEVVTDKARLFGKRRVYRSHLETCPFAELYRGRARKRTNRPNWSTP